MRVDDGDDTPDELDRKIDKRIRRRLRPWAKGLIIVVGAAAGSVGGIASGMLNAREQAGADKNRLQVLEREVDLLRARLDWSGAPRAPSKGTP